MFILRNIVHIVDAGLIKKNTMSNTYIICSTLLLLRLDVSHGTLCREPDDLPSIIGQALYELYSDPTYGNFSMKMVPCLQEAYRVNNFNSIVTHRHHRCEVYEPETGCALPDQGGHITTHSGVFERARCKWEYEIDYDEMRIPSRLAKALCSCRHCHRGMCHPVNSYLPTIRKVCNPQTGIYAYRKYITEVPVGCACVLNLSAAQGTRHQHLLRMSVNKK